MTWRAFYAAGLAVITARATALLCLSHGGCKFLPGGMLQYYEVRISHLYSGCAPIDTPFALRLLPDSAAYVLQYIF